MFGLLNIRNWLNIVSDNYYKMKINLHSLIAESISSVISA